MTDELKDEKPEFTSAEDVINVENNRYKNKARLLVVSTLCALPTLFIVGVIINMVFNKTPVDGGVLTTTLLPLVDLFKIMSGM